LEISLRYVGTQSFSCHKAVSNLIVKLIPATTNDMRVQPYMIVSGATFNSNKTDGFFDVNAAQYTSYYKSNCTLSNLPVRGHFDLNKFKAKRPIPSNNTYVSIEGFLRDVETDMMGQATLFNMSIENISFLGRAVLPASMAAGQGKCYLC